jgi:hypothetical protein
MIFLLSFYAYSFSKVNLQHSSKIKSHKKSQNSRNQGFSSFFGLLMEVSGSGPVKIITDPGAAPGGSKIIGILRIRNTVLSNATLHRSFFTYKQNIDTHRFDALKITGFELSKPQ